MGDDTTSFRDKVAAFFQARSGQWINGLAIAQVGGVYGWRTRISDCRLQLGMTIENRVRYEGRKKVSEYRYVPDDEPQRTMLF